MRPGVSCPGDGASDDPGDGCETLVFPTNPNAADTDGDKLGDGAEALRYRSDALSMNTDGSVEPHPCREGQEAASLNGDYAANQGDQAVLSNFIVVYGSTYNHFDHARRTFDINRDGAVNPGDQATLASVLGTGGNCRP